MFFSILETSLYEQVLLTLVQGAADFPDISTQKMCFSVLKKLIEMQAIQGNKQNCSSLI